MTTFSDRVVQLARMVPAGRVTTYGRIARAAGGGPVASRSVTAILGKAYEQGQRDIPFHRIVYADGRVWLDSTHEQKRRALYKKEGIELDKNNMVKDFQDKLFLFE